ncbi:hypothetical protein BU17DRAFT_63429 [Hysterangium stoloniferum]|nr:hypothetical protein BU17DRAFT_63429 [Hysterangium stoloniferum]
MLEEMTEDKRVTWHRAHGFSSLTFSQYLHCTYTLLLLYLPNPYQNSPSKSSPISSPSKHTITTTTTTTTCTKPTTAARSPTITPKAAIQFELELVYPPCQCQLPQRHPTYQTVQLFDLSCHPSQPHQVTSLLAQQQSHPQPLPMVLVLVHRTVLCNRCKCDEDGSQRHEHVEAEASTAVVNENGHGHGVPRLQKPPVGLGVGLKMRMQTKANLNVDVAQSPTLPEYPYTFPRVPPSPSCPASNPPAAWAGGAMSIVQTMDANGHLQAHIHDHDTGKDATIGQNDDNTHGDGGGGGMNMNESMESAQKPPRSPLFDAGDPFRREGRGPQTQTQIRAPMSAPASVTTTPSRGLGVSRVWV